jgi:hypothetical protein
MMKLASFATVCALVVGMSFVVADETAKDAKKVNLKEIKCPVSGAAVKEASTRDYKGAKVYFCCDNCPKKFDAEIAKNKVFQEKANLQLVATKQATQEKCPITGKALNKEKTEKVAGVVVTFCCDGCKGKVASAKDDAAKLALVFSDPAFDKGFKVKGAKKAEKESKGPLKKKKRDKEN